MELEWLKVEERRPAVVGAWEAWNQHLPQETFCKVRLKTMQSPWGRGSWRMPAYRDPEGRVVAALSLYSFFLSEEGREISAAGIGSFVVSKEERGRGIGRAFLREVHDVLRREGVQVAFLFSEIGPSLYESLGYRSIPNLTTSIPVSALRSSPSFSLPAPGQIAALSLPLEATAIHALLALEGHVLARFPWALKRSAELWEHRLEHPRLSDQTFASPPERLFLVEAPFDGAASASDGSLQAEGTTAADPGSWRAFVRGFVADEGKGIFLIQEYGCKAGSEASLWRLVQAIPERTSTPLLTVAGVFPPSLLAGWFEALPEATDDRKLMFCPLQPSAWMPNAPGGIWPSDWF